MKPMTEVAVLRTVPVSDDGITIRMIKAGTQDRVASDLFPGLEAEGYVTALGAAPPAQTPAPATTGFTLPDGWRDLHHFKLVALAKEAGFTVKTKAEAVAALEAFESPAQA
jgi:hypothetical protein